MMLEIEVNLDGIRFCGDDDEHLELHNCRIVPAECPREDHVLWHCIQSLLVP
jgi:hypothetical protein